MESRGERAENYLNDAVHYFNNEGITPEAMQDQLRAVQADMTEALRLLVEWGELTQEEADEREYEWMQRYCPGEQDGQ
jgi:hypothetical protein